jgi:hypothetical protein
LFGVFFRHGGLPLFAMETRVAAKPVTLGTWWLTARLQAATIGDVNGTAGSGEDEKEGVHRDPVGVPIEQAFRRVR